MNKRSPIIQPEELLNLKLQNKTFVLLDADGGGRERYLTNHLDGAFFVDLETDLSAATVNASNGGRHPLPTPIAFAQTISKFGINAETHVIIYDDKNGANAAARLWWMFTAIGYENVQVLNKGLKGALAVGYPSNTDASIPTPTSVDTSIMDWKLPLVTIEEVEVASKTQHQIIVDVRAKDRYDGLVEPLDLVAGHIPNAVNIPLTENLNELGAFREPSFLKDKYNEAFKDTTSDNIIVHCGSGVTACHTLLAFAYADLPIPNLYIGSWSEWSRSGKPMILKSE